MSNENKTEKHVSDLTISYAVLFGLWTTAIWESEIHESGEGESRDRWFGPGTSENDLWFEPDGNTAQKHFTEASNYFGE